ncbi:MAG: purine-nucleoside phosphorylase [Planctomycetes bacterium]|nr:purine-nucleoside phosphorylase [Planctomycetota bacterium]
MTKTKLSAKIKEATNTIRKKLAFKPDVGVILGTGLGKLAEEIKVKAVLPYSKIPHFPVSTVLSHKGELLLGTLNGTKVIAMDGRFHYYEGYSLEDITLPVRVIKALGAKTLIVSSAVGGLNPKYQRGDLIIIEDHINLMGVNPLIGPNDDTLGTRFPDMSEPYNRKFIAQAESIAKKLGITAHRGVYVALTGPNLETRAEYRFLRIIGADVVGMSTVPEVIVGIHAGLKILGISAVTDMCIPETLRPANIKEIIKIANQTEPKMTALVKEFIRKIN